MFSKYDVYTSVQSKYCYQGTSVLKNKLGIREPGLLRQAEEEFTAVKQMVLMSSPINGRFTKSHLLRIHKFLFEDIYPFAGRIRKEDISKGNTMFYPSSMVDKELDRVFTVIHSAGMLTEKDRDTCIKNLSYIMAELNVIHPFREGNGRAIREFVRCIANEYEIDLNWGNAGKEELLAASVMSVDDESAFIDLLTKCIEN